MKNNAENNLVSEKPATRNFARAINDLGASTENAAVEVKAALRNVAKHVGGSAKQAASAVSANLNPESVKNAVASYTRAHPFVMLGGAFAAGLLISHSLRRAKRKLLNEVS